MPAAMASTAMRAYRTAGKRSRPCQPRRHTTKRPRPGTRNHGRLRGRSWASWRRRTMTVRRSWTVTAKRSWPTSPVRRSAASSDSPPSSAMPIATSARTPTTPRRSIQCTRNGHNARLPSVVVGAGIFSARSAAAHARMTAPMSEAIHGLRRTPEATMAAPISPNAMAAPAPAPLSAHRKPLSPSRRQARTPPMAPTTAPRNAANRIWRSAGEINAVRRPTGASRV